ncbi:MAG: hypothetical protein Ta2D_07810 [Rickettsiales bacterium]|nr:MAG: hypothetical protein Ta2D_07810 [Rickettsiales bacterium]
MFFKVPHHIRISLIILISSLIACTNKTNPVNLGSNHPDIIFFENNINIRNALLKEMNVDELNTALNNVMKTTAGTISVADSPNGIITITFNDGENDYDFYSDKFRKFEKKLVDTNGTLDKNDDTYYTIYTFAATNDNGNLLELGAGSLKTPLLYSNFGMINNAYYFGYGNTDKEQDFVSGQSFTGITFATLDKGNEKKNLEGSVKLEINAQETLEINFANYYTFKFIDKNYHNFIDNRDYGKEGFKDTLKKFNTNGNITGSTDYKGYGDVEAKEAVGVYNISDDNGLKINGSFGAN